METSEQVESFKEFLDAYYHAALLGAVGKGDTHLSINFSILSKHDPDLASDLLDTPEDVLRAFQLSLDNYDIDVNKDKFRFRVYNLPQKEMWKIRNIRSIHINQLICIEGVVRQKSDVRPKVVTANFECPSCGNSMQVKQDEDKLKLPVRCTKCGHKGRFRQLGQELVDSQGMVLEEVTMDLEGGEQPKRLKIFLQEDLVSPITEKKTNPGTSIRIVGILKEIVRVDRAGTKMTTFDYLFEANHVESLAEDYSDIQITAAEEKFIKELAAHDQVINKLVKSSAPGIYGHDIVKEAILLQFVGGVQKKRTDGVKSRGDLHILLIGDPGSGKCASGDVATITPTGNILTLKEFVDNQTLLDADNLIAEIPMASLDFHGRMHDSKATRVWKRKHTGPLLKIKTQTGKELVLTKEHPLFECVYGHICAKKAEEFTVGQRIAIPRQITIKNDHQSFQTIKGEVCLITAPVARLLGYLCGDGFISTKNNQIQFTNANKTVLQDYTRCYKNIFDEKPTCIKKKNHYRLDSYKKSTHVFFETNFPESVRKSASKKIPLKILESPDHILSAYVSALFDCDSHVNVTKKQIEYTTISKELATQIQLSLLRFGIVCYLKEKTKYATNTEIKRKVTAYEVIIGREFLDMYFQEIGFISETKNEALIEIIFSSKPRNTNVDLIPNLHKLLKQIRLDINLRQKDMGVPRPTYAHYEQQNRLPSRTTVQKIVKYLEQSYDTDELRVLRQIAFSDVFWDEIISIEEVLPVDQYVYDIEIQETHNFIANGVVVHNSQLLKRAAVFAPKARYVSGKGASAAGLTASVIKDDFMGGWALEAGALVLANRGTCMIDELDKMTEEDRSAMHEALEQQTVTISKANIQATLMCETTVLAAANPKMGRFDPFENIAKQINLPPALINRFDLIFPFRDIPNVEGDEKLATFVLGMHQANDNEKPEIDTDTLRKYIVYAKKNIHPKITDGALQELKTYYVKMRNSSQGEDGVTVISISARQLEALVRLTEANAKLRLSQKAVKKDAKRAIELLDYCLSQIGVDPETGRIDIDRIQTGFTTSQRSKVINVREIIKGLEEKLGKVIPIEDIVDAAAQKGMDSSKIDEALERLKLNGDIFEPKRGFISRIV